ncbi:MAG: hypothetical protein WC907_00980 [Acholeplasmataceae bacterium]|jgi:hypothetical protein
MPNEMIALISLGGTPFIILHPERIMAIEESADSWTGESSGESIKPVSILYFDNLTAGIPVRGSAWDILKLLQRGRGQADAEEFTRSQDV